MFDAGRGGKEYPCSDDHVVIDLKARRLTQVPGDQPQDHCNRRQGKTYIVRNQDLTRPVVAGVRKLVLSLAGARDQGGEHFVPVSAFTLRVRART